MSRTNKEYLEILGIINGLNSLPKKEAYKILSEKHQIPESLAQKIKRLNLLTKDVLKMFENNEFSLEYATKKLTVGLKNRPTTKVLMNRMAKIQEEKNASATKQVVTKKAIPVVEEQKSKDVRKPVFDILKIANGLRKLGKKELKELDSIKLKSLQVALVRAKNYIEGVEDTIDALT